MNLMNHDTCPSVRTLSAWLDGELGQSEAPRIRDHVEHCATCREQAGAWMHAVRGTQQEIGSAEMTAATCPDPETVAAYAERELPHSSTAVVEEHLRHCAACVAEVQRLIHLREAVGVDRAPSIATLTKASESRSGIRTAEPIHAPSGFGSLAQELRARMILRLPAFGALAVVALVLVVVGVRLLPGGQHSSGDTIYRGPATQPMAEVAVDHVAARARPGKNEIVVATLPRGTRVTPLEQSGNWTRVELADGRRVWMRAEELVTPKQGEKN